MELNVVETVIYNLFCTASIPVSLMHFVCYSFILYSKHDKGLWSNTLNTYTSNMSNGNMLLFSDVTKQLVYSKIYQGPTCTAVYVCNK